MKTHPTAVQNYLKAIEASAGDLKTLVGHPDGWPAAIEELCHIQEFVWRIVNPLLDDLDDRTMVGVPQFERAVRRVRALRQANKPQPTLVLLAKLYERKIAADWHEILEASNKPGPVP